MKLRIKGPSIRLRLTQSKVAGFAETGFWQETTPMPGGTLTYKLLRSAEANGLEASWEAGMLTLLVSDSAAAAWATTEEISMRGEITLESGEVLKLLVEKDFACLDNTEEDQSDNYPNPHATC